MMKFITAFLIFAFIFLQYKLWFDKGGLPEMMRLHHEIAIQLQDNQTLAARNDGLQAEVNDLKTGHAAVEERARSELGMVKQGETYYQVVHPDPSSASSKP